MRSVYQRRDVDRLGHGAVARIARMQMVARVERGAQAEEARLPTASRFRVNNALAIREALVLGSGIGVCPAWLVRDLLDSGELVRVLEGWSARAQDLYLLYPSRQFLPLRTRLFIDFAAGQFEALAGFDRPMRAQEER
jgi:DNA-binding transcriptional LysR family regulator